MPPLIYGQHAYHISIPTQTRKAADEQCHSLGGHILTLNSFEEMLFLKKLLGNRNVDLNTFQSWMEYKKFRGVFISQTHIPDFQFFRWWNTGYLQHDCAFFDTNTMEWRTTNCYRDKSVVCKVAGEKR